MVKSGWGYCFCMLFICRVKTVQIPLPPSDYCTPSYLTILGILVKPVQIVLIFP